MRDVGVVVGTARPAVVVVPDSVAGGDLPWDVCGHVIDRPDTQLPCTYTW